MSVGGVRNCNCEAHLPEVCAAAADCLRRLRAELVFDREEERVTHAARARRGLAVHRRHPVLSLLNQHTIAREESAELHPPQ